MVASNLFAGLSTVLDLSSGYRDPNSVGGEFTAVLSSSTTYDNKVINNTTVLANYATVAKTAGGFETFCVEINEDFSPGTTYNAQISSTILPDPGAQYDYITLGTAYLYSQFAQGTLADYDYTAGYNSMTKMGRELSADELQDAIWFLQGEINSSGKVILSGSEITSVNDSLYTFSASTDPFILLAEENIYHNTNSAALTKIETDADGAYGVLALDLTSSNGQSAQDQLIYCPVPEAATFAAGAMLLFPLGLSTLRSLRKKQTN
jgi:hypothetical protein